MPPKKAAAAEPQVDSEPVETVEAQAADEAADPIAELNATVIPMRHRDGNGPCDLYKSDEHGNILVPAGAAAAMIEHGFVVADEA